MSLKTCLLAALLATLPFSALAQERVLKLGTEGAYPPFNNATADGKLEGFDIDIGNALCAEMKVKCEWIVQDWDGMIPALQGGKFDAIMASMFITDERKAQIDFTDRYYRTPTAWIVPKDSAIEGVEPAEFAGKIVGVQGSGVYSNYAAKFLKDSTIKPYATVQDSLADLSNGRVDAVLDDLVVLHGYLESPAGACCRLVGTVEHDDSLGEGAGIGLRKGDPLVAGFNAAINAIRANGTYARISDRHFGLDLYGE